MAKRKPLAADYGLTCPNCGGRRLPAIYTDPVDDGAIRVRQCRDCGCKTKCHERLIGLLKKSKSKIKK